MNLSEIWPPRAFLIILCTRYGTTIYLFKMALQPVPLCHATVTKPTYTYQHSHFHYVAQMIGYTGSSPQPEPSGQ